MRGILRNIAILFITLASFQAGAFLSGQLQQFKADKWSVVGKNVFVSGGVHIPYGEYEIYADEAVINLENKDVEAWGNVRFYRWQKSHAAVTPAELAELKRRDGVVVNVTGLVGDVWGNSTIKVEGMVMTSRLSAKRVVGNFSSGYFRFDDMAMVMDTTACRAKSGERLPNGTIVVRDAGFSTCEYQVDDNAHYSISASKATMVPYASDLPGLKDVKKSSGDYAVTMSNSFVEIYGIPVLWLPFFYKPREQHLGICTVNFGKNGDWGYFAMLSREFVFNEYPYSAANVMLDFYEDRGEGYGMDAVFATENSRTDFFAYGIYDERPNEGVDYRKYRIDVPHWRYDLRLSNVTHITPHLDFRGVIEYASDPYMTHDFFNARYRNDPAPSTFVALEQQFDHFSASIYYRPRINSYYTTVEKTPEVRLDVHRQELFDTNIYYQGNTTAGYNRMRWIKFDRGFKNPAFNHDPLYRLDNYEAFRLSTTHFLYYPLNFDWLTLVPRAGLKFMVYSNSSENKVTANDLIKMFKAANPENTAAVMLNHYDNEGGTATRLAGELGLEASAKFHNTWGDVRNRFLRIDGLRHIIRPYINYTYMDVWGDSREHIYYFDDEDRIKRQHFIRFGLENRLQTRDGSGLRDWFTMENYWDFHFEKSGGFGTVDRFSRLGDFCTILTASPIKGLTLSTKFAIALSDQNGPVPDTIRYGRNVGKTGLDCRWLNYWDVSLTYEPLDDVKFTLRYTYNRPYASRSAYSMGSTLTEISSGSYFDKYYDDHNEEISAEISLPLTPDRRTFGAAKVSYDFYKGSLDDISFYIARQFHCIEVSAHLGFERNDPGDDDGKWDTSFSVNARLLGVGAPVGPSANSMLTRTNQLLRMPSSRNFL